MKQFFRLFFAFLKTQNLRYHLLGWFLLFGSENLVGYVLLKKANIFLRFLPFVPFELAYFYFSSFVIFRYPFQVEGDKLAIYKQSGRLLLVIAGYVLLTVPIRYLLLRWSHEAIPGNFIVYCIAAGMFRATYLIGYSLAFGTFFRLLRTMNSNNRLQLRQVKSKQMKAEVEKELVISRNAYLQARINPHLLMNSLNFVYNSVEEHSEEAAELVDLLSRIMRYALREPDTDGKVPLMQEWAQVELLLELQEIRFGRRFNIDKELSGDWEKARIPPILLLTFVENMFKHGDIHNEHSQSTISVKVEDDALYFRTINRIASTKASMSTHIGLENVKIRLETLYGSTNYRFETIMINNEFRLELYLNLRTEVTIDV